MVHWGVNYQQPGTISRYCRSLRDQIGRQRVVIPLKGVIDACLMGLWLSCTRLRFNSR